VRASGPIAKPVRDLADGPAMSVSILAPCGLRATPHAHSRRAPAGSIALGPASRPSAAGPRPSSVIRSSAMPVSALMVRLTRLAYSGHRPSVSIRSGQRQARQRQARQSRAHGPQAPGSILTPSGSIIHPRAEKFICERLRCSTPRRPGSRLAPSHRCRYTLPSETPEFPDAASNSLANLQYS
jgi:hypothetical protein